MTKASWRYKFTLLCLYMVAYGVFYLWPNFSPIFAPTQLPLLDIDRAMPFVPWTFLIYLSDYLLFTVAFVLLVEIEEWNAFVRVAFATLAVCGCFFLFYPTTYPRPNYPAVTNPIVAFAMNLIATADTPNNCFPSMHVAMTSVVAWSFRKRSRPLFAFLLLWSVAIFYSTLTTKQHYFMDIIGGLSVVAVLAVLDGYCMARGWSRRLARSMPFLRSL